MITSVEEAARDIYDREVCARSFDDDFILHWNNPSAIVYKDHDSLAFVRPVNRADPYELLTDPSYNPLFPDCWWVHLLVGDFARIYQYLPRTFSWIGWERANRPRFYNLNHLERWIISGRISTLLSSVPAGN